MLLPAIARFTLIALIGLLLSSCAAINMDESFDSDEAFDSDDKRALELAAESFSFEHIGSTPKSLKNKTFSTMLSSADFEFDTVYFTNKNWFLKSAGTDLETPAGEIQDFRDLIIQKWDVNFVTEDDHDKLCFVSVIDDCFFVVSLSNKIFEKAAKRACDAGYQGKKCEFLTFNNFKYIAKNIISELYFDDYEKDIRIADIESLEPLFLDCLNAQNELKCAGQLYKQFFIRTSYDIDKLADNKLGEPAYIIFRPEEKDGDILKFFTLWDEKNGDALGLQKRFNKAKPPPQIITDLKDYWDGNHEKILDLAVDGAIAVVSLIRFFTAS